MLRAFDDVGRDLAYAVRSLRRTPGFTFASVLTLAIGIGATTTIYSVVDSVLLQPLPFHDADRLVRVAQNDVRNMRSLNFSEFQEWRTRTKTLSGLAAMTMNPQVLIQTRQGTARLAGGYVSFNYFEVLGARAAAGRLIQSTDESNPDVVVLSDPIFRQVFGGDEKVIGSTLEFRSGPLAGRLVTVIGVLPETAATGELDLDFYAPIVVPPGSKPIGVAMIGRLAPGASMPAAVEEANAIGGALRPNAPDTPLPENGPRFVIVTLKDQMVRSLRPALRIFLAAVAGVLLIVCANLANLLLARGTARQREIAVRLAIGAGRGRIVRQILAECLVLAGAGGLFGAALAAAGVTLVKQLAVVNAPGVFRLAYGSSVLPRAGEVGVDPKMLGIAFSIAALTSVIFGLLPALHLSRAGQLQAMSTRGATFTRRDTHVRSALVVAQMVMATVLLVGAGLLARSFISLADSDRGYDASHALGFQLVLPTEYSTERKAQTITTLLDRLRALPEVTSAGFSYSGVLLGIEDTVGTLVPPGRTLDEMRADTSGMTLEQMRNDQRPRVRSVSPGFFGAFGIRILSGRDFTATDDASAPLVIALDRATATRHFGDANPVGAHLDWYPTKGAAVQLTVIGVVDDVRQGNPSNAAKPQFYVDFRQMLEIGRRWKMTRPQAEGLAFGFQALAARTTGNPAAIIPAVRRVVRDIDPLAGIDAILPLEQLLGASMARQRFYAVMLGVFAAVAALLAAIGVYGVLAYAVIQRTQEMGVRMALGARRWQVLRLVLGRGLLLSSIGVAFGLLGAAWGAKYLQGMLFGIIPLDAVTFVGVAVGFVLIAMLASLLPARRATQVDPVVALRAE